MIRSKLIIFILMSSFSWSMGCTVESDAAVANPPSCSVEVATAELHSINEDLILQDLLRNQQVNSRLIDKHVALGILQSIIVLRATSVDVTALKGTAVETLCLVTTDGVRAELAKAEDAEMLEAANEYLDAIELDVRREVSRIQQTMLGTGCSLSP